MYYYNKVHFLLELENEKILNELKKLFYPHIEEKESTLKEDFKFIISTNEKEYLFYLDKLKELDKERFFVTKCSKKMGEIILERNKYREYSIFKYIGKKIILIQKDENYILYYLEDEISYSEIYKGIFVILEHIIQKYMNLKGGILLHASAVINGEGEVTLFIGEKRSGKTTIFFESCKKENIFPVAVDKVYLYLNSFGKLEIKGFPSRLRVLAGTLSKYEELQKLIPDKYKNVSKEILWQGLSDSKVTIEIMEFENIINKKFKSEGILNKIIFPKINRDENFSITEISDKEKIYSKLNNCIYTPINIEEDWWSEIGKNSEKLIRENRDKIIEEMIKKFQFIEITAGEEINNIPLD